MSGPVLKELISGCLFRCIPDGTRGSPTVVLLHGIHSHTDDNPYVSQWTHMGTFEPINLKVKFPEIRLYAVKLSLRRSSSSQESSLLGEAGYLYSCLLKVHAEMTEDTGPIILLAYSAGCLIALKLWVLLVKTAKQGGDPSAEPLLRKISGICFLAPPFQGGAFARIYQLMKPVSGWIMALLCSNSREVQELVKEGQQVISGKILKDDGSLLHPGLQTYTLLETHGFMGPLLIVPQSSALALPTSRIAASVPQSTHASIPHLSEKSPQLIFLIDFIESVMSHRGDGPEPAPRVALKVPQRDVVVATCEEMTELPGQSRKPELPIIDTGPGSEHVVALCPTDHLASHLDPQSEWRTVEFITTKEGKVEKKRGMIQGGKLLSLEPSAISEDAENEAILCREEDGRWWLTILGDKFTRGLLICKGNSILLRSKLSENGEVRLQLPELCELATGQVIVLHKSEVQNAYDLDFELHDPLREDNISCLQNLLGLTSGDNVCALSSKDHDKMEAHNSTYTAFTYPVPGTRAWTKAKTAEFKKGSQNLYLGKDAELSAS